MQFKKTTTLIFSFALAINFASSAVAASPANDIETFLQKETQLTGTFIKTSAKADDKDDNFLAYNSKCEWNVEKKEFTFTIYDNLAPDGVNKEVGKFVFSATSGFEYIDVNKNKVVKSGALTTFYKNFWDADKLDLAKAFNIKKDLIIEDGNVLHNEYTLSPKGMLPAIGIKRIELDLDKDMKKLLYLRFQVDKTSYTWSTDSDD